jgi:pyridoxal phosphate enzyme (YggS family)
MISQKLDEIQQKIQEICHKSGRNFDDITLIGVTKYAEVSAIEDAIESGLVHIAENKVQEGQRKFSALKRDVTKHMIGHLQTNKVRQAIELFDVIQSVDSLKVAQEIDRRCQQLDSQKDILIQVNTSGEQQKYGFAVEDVADALQQVSRMEGVSVKGLMTIAPFVEDEGIIRQAFSSLKTIFDQFNQEYKDHPRVSMQYLSMGMTHDFPIAIEEGSNMLRIGRAIFA